MVCNLRNVALFLGLLCLWVVSDAVHAATEAPRELDTALQQVKRDMLGLDEKIRQLTGDGSQPGLETVSVYVSVDADISFQLEKVRLKLDGKTVSEPAFYRTQQQALKRGGAANIHTGILMQGRHRLEAIFIGTGNNGKRAEYREQWNLTQLPGRRSMVELHLRNATFSQAPAIDMRVVD